MKSNYLRQRTRKRLQKTAADQKTATEQPSVLLSINKLAEKLNKPALEINDIDIKQAALTKLADLMSDDIADLLLEIRYDLKRVNMRN